MADWVAWIKAGHVLAVIAWMAGLFYLPRLFVYHADSEVGSEVSELFKVMERRLLMGIMRPAGVVALAFGIWAGLTGAWFESGEYWLPLKLILAAGLVVYHFRLEAFVWSFAADVRTQSSRYFRVLNEVPSVLLIGIVILVVVKPF
jgi:protoporphyrinogen IX oxidase